VLGTDVRFPEKKLAGRNFYRFFYWCCAACLRGAMRENIGSVGAMRERDRFHFSLWSFHRNFLKNYKIKIQMALH
jgi:polyferredoxin